MRALVAYPSDHGSARGAAQHLGSLLAEHGLIAPGHPPHPVSRDRRGNAAAGVRPRAGPRPLRLSSLSPVFARRSR